MVMKFGSDKVLRIRNGCNRISLKIIVGMLYAKFKRRIGTIAEIVTLSQRGTRGVVL